MQKWCKILSSVLFNLLSICSFSQGAWLPPGADHSFPRTLADSAAVPSIRNTLNDPEILSLYHSIWQNACSVVPEENSSDTDRFNRAMIAKEAAFVILMDSKYENGTIQQLPSSEKDSLINKVVKLLQNINTHVGFQAGWTFYNEWQHRSKELITYLIAYDLLRGAGFPESQLMRAEDSLIAFTGHLYARAMAVYTVYTLPLQFFSYQFNNHSIMTASALGLAAIIFNDHTDSVADREPLNWINTGFWNLDNTLWVENGIYPRVSEPDTLAGYAEGPNYFAYAFENAFPFIRSMGNFLPEGNVPVTFNGLTRDIPNPWYDTRYDRLYDWLNKIQMPDGSQPAIHDSRIGFGSVIAALSGKSRYNRLNPAFTPDDPFIRTQYICTNVAHGNYDDSLFQVLPAAGSLVFRSSWDNDATCLHIIGKHDIALKGAKSHHQGDATSFSLFSHGQLMALDPGYAGASLADAVKKATDHNLILVNGYGPMPPTGETVNVQTNTAYIENCFHTQSLDYGEVRTNFAGTDIIRKVLFLRSTYFFLADFISSPYTLDFTFQLHGNGLLNSLPESPEGAFVPDTLRKRCHYVRDSVTLFAQVLAKGNQAVYHNETDSLSAQGDIFRHYTKFLVTNHQTDTTLFLTTLFPYKGPAPDVNAVLISDPGPGTKVGTGNTRDFVFCSIDGSHGTILPDSSGLSEALFGNGKINLYSESNTGQFLSVFIQSGDSLLYGTQPYILAGKKIDIAVELSGTNISGYVSDSGTVRIFSETPLQAVNGAISSIHYDPVQKLASISFSGKGNFLLAPGESVEKKPMNGILSVSIIPNPSRDGYFTIMTSCRGITRVQFTVSDVTGKVLISFHRKISADYSSFPLDLSGYKNGYYLLHVKDHEQIQVIPLIIKK